MKIVPVAQKHFESLTNPIRKVAVPLKRSLVEDSRNESSSNVYPDKNRKSPTYSRSRPYIRSAVRIHVQLRLQRTKQVSFNAHWYPMVAAFILSYLATLQLSSDSIGNLIRQP